MVSVRLLTMSLLQSVLGDEPVHRLRIIFFQNNDHPNVGQQTSDLSEPLDDVFKMLMPSVPSGMNHPSDSLSQDILSAIPALDPSGTVLPLLSHLTQNDDCTEDANRYCSSSIHSEVTAPYWKCMSQHKNSLRPACLASIKQHVPFICHDMAGLHCDGIETGVLACLATKKDLLQPDCRFALEATQRTIEKVSASPKWAVVNHRGTLLHIFENHTEAGWSFLQFMFLVAILCFLWIASQDRTIKAAVTQMVQRKHSRGSEVEQEVHMYGAL